MIGFDLSKFDHLAQSQEDGIQVEILDPAGKSIEASIRVSGPDSTRQKMAMQAIQDERLAEENSSPFTTAKIEENSIRILAKATIGWTGFTNSGVDFPFNEENAIMLYTRFPFIREQVERKAARRASFMKSSVTPSAGL